MDTGMKATIGVIAVVGLGVGGYFLWRHFRGKQHPYFKTGDIVASVNNVPWEIYGVNPGEPPSYGYYAMGPQGEIYATTIDVIEIDTNWHLVS